MFWGKRSGKLAMAGRNTNLKNPKPAKMKTLVNMQAPTDLCNLPFLPVTLQAGAVVTDLGVARDQMGQLEGCLDRAIAEGMDILITSGWSC